MNFGWSAGSHGRANRYDASDVRLSESFMRSSVETLGSSGFRTLLAPELKLDGKEDGVKKSDAGELDAMKSKLDGLMKSLGEAAGVNINNEGGHNILEVAMRLQADMKVFPVLCYFHFRVLTHDNAFQTHLAHFNEKYETEQALEKELKQRDERMKEEGLQHTFF